MKKINFLETVIGISLIPLFILNIAAGIIGSVWLILLGQWQYIVFGFMAGFVMPFAYSLISAPILLLISPLERLQKRGSQKIFKVISWLIMLFHHTINFIWVFAVAAISLGLAESNSHNVWPYLLAGYGVAIGALRYMARGEDRNASGTYSALWLAQMSYIILASFFLLDISYLTIPLVLILTIAIEVYQLRSIKTESNIFSQ